MDDRLALKVTHPDGSIRRWGFDQPDARDIPGDLNWRTAIPGGNMTLSCSLLRDLLDADGPSLFSSVECYGPGGRTAFDGYFTQFPRDDQTITPGAAGWSSTMRFDTGFTEIYIDRDISRWGDMPLDRKIYLSGVANSYGDFSFAGGLGGLVCALPNQALGTQTLAEAWYIAPAGCKIANLLYRGAKTTLPASWITPFVAGDSLAPPTESYTPTLDGAIHQALLSTARKYLGTEIYSAGNASTPAAGSSVRFDRLAVYGNHGLTAQAITGEPDGYYGHDLIANIVTRAASLLTATQGVGGIESNTSFVIPQAVFLEPTTAEQAVLAINLYYLWEWGVYDDRRFFWRAPDADRLTWRARRDKGARLSPEDETADQQFNGAMVFYTDPEGNRKIAGPPAAYWQGGIANADVTSASLVDTSPVNPVNAAGMPRRWGKLEIPFHTTDSGATTLGLVWLAEHSLPQRRGTITLTGTVEHPVEGDVPVWRVRAGDWIQIGDLPGDEPRRIIETTYTHGSRQLQASVGATDFRLDAVLERVGVQLVGVQL